MALKERIPTGLCQSGLLHCGTSPTATFAIVDRCYVMKRLLNSLSNREAQSCRFISGSSRKEVKYFQVRPPRVACRERAKRVERRGPACAPLRRVNRIPSRGVTGLLNFPPEADQPSAEHSNSCSSTKTTPPDLMAGRVVF